VPPVAGPGPTDQVNLTDEESRIMPVPGGGFEQCYNAQAAVAVGCLLVVATDVVQAHHDEQQVEPMLGRLGALPTKLGQTATLLADTGYFSAANVRACVAAQVDPLIAMGRQPHYPPLAERLASPRHRRRRRIRRWSRRWRIASRRRREGRFTPCASTPLSRCSASSNRCWGFASFCCAGSRIYAASGAL